MKKTCLALLLTLFSSAFADPTSETAEVNFNCKSVHYFMTEGTHTPRPNVTLTQTITVKSISEAVLTQTLLPVGKTTITNLMTYRINPLVYTSGKYSFKKVNEDVGVLVETDTSESNPNVKTLITYICNKIAL